MFFTPKYLNSNNVTGFFESVHCLVLVSMLFFFGLWFGVVWFFFFPLLWKCGLFGVEYLSGDFSYCAFKIDMLNPLGAVRICAYADWCWLNSIVTKTHPWKPHLGWCWHVPHILPVFRSCLVVLCGKCYRDKS